MKIKKEKISLLLILVFLSIYSSFAQTKVSGYIPGAEGFRLRYTYPEDFISTKKAILFETEIDSSGKFELSIDFDKTLFGKFELPYFYTEFILEPDKTYHIEFDSVQIHNVIRPFFQKIKLSYEIQKPKESLEINCQEINQIYDNYIFENFNSIYRNHQLGLLDSLETILNDRLKKEDNFFLKHWLEYRMADTKLQLSHSNKDRKKSFNQYLNGREVLYSSPVYMKYFSNYFKDFFKNNINFTTRDINYSINIVQSFKALQDSIGKDTLMRNEQIRELVTLLNLKDLYQNKSFSKDGILSVLEQMQESKFQEHQQIAKNLLSELPKLNTGQKVANFILPNIKKNHEDSLQLLDFDGKQTYVIFYNSHNINCVRQLDKLDELYKKHTINVHFFAISLDEEFSTAKKLYTLKNYSFPMAWNGWDWKLIDYFKIRTFPTFVSLDEEGKIIRYPEYEVDEINFE